MLLLAKASKTFLATPADAGMIETWKEIGSIDELDQDHVIPNMGQLLCRGVWFPNLPHIQ
jgi:hypothetical protein